MLVCDRVCLKRKHDRNPLSGTVEEQAELMSLAMFFLTDRFHWRKRRRQGRSLLIGLRRIALVWVCLVLFQGPILLPIIRVFYPSPQAILTLGGRWQRETYTARFALAHPTLPIWISSGLTPDKVLPMFYDLGIADNRLTLDYRAVDTVTNFTTLVADLQVRHIHHIYLITSDFHMARAEAIATIVLGSHGITFTPVPVISMEPPESGFRIARDMIRSWLWLVIGYTGSSLSGRSMENSERLFSDAHSTQKILVQGSKVKLPQPPTQLSNF